MGRQSSSPVGVELDTWAREPSDTEHPMTDAHALPRIRSVTAGPDYHVTVIWDDSKQTNVDLTTVVKSGGVFSPLRDKNLFATVQVGERGRSLEWPDPRNPAISFADFDAD